MDKTTKIQVQYVTPPTNFFENLSIDLKMGSIRELYVIQHLKKTAMQKNIFSRRYRLSIFFFTFFGKLLKFQEVNLPMIWEIP